jgi:DNA-binding CsgD family transcriptional regulator
MGTLKPSTKAIKAAWMFRKRAEAAAAGLCARCCKVRPETGYKVCRSCQTSIKEYRRRHRVTGSRRATWQDILAAHERAGDLAHERYFHDGAAQHYREALAYANTGSTRVRIYEKLARTLYLGNNPGEADRWLEMALSSNTGTTEHAPKLAELLLKRAQARWAKGHGNEELRDIAQAITIAKSAEDSNLYKRANFAMFWTLRNMGKIENSEPFIDAIGDVDENDDPGLRIGFFSQKARTAAIAGSREVSYGNFDRALLTAQEEKDDLQICMVLMDYGRWSLALADTMLAKTNLERALLHARHSQIIWFIPYLCLEYADLLSRMGQLNVAHHYVREALSERTPAPAVELLYPEAGIRIALDVQDEEALALCTKPGLLEAAFQSQSPHVLGPVAAGFARFYAATKHVKRAQDILHRALRSLPNVARSWDVCLETARQGYVNDIPRARVLLESRAAIPNPAVARAYLSLFDAFVAQRRKQESQMRQFAEKAIKQFEHFHWYGYADLARTMVPMREPHVQRTLQTHAPLAGIRPLLTARQYQVAELVLQGLSNRTIAERLSISKYTVDSHVASIINRIGVRSRHQLAEALSDQEVSVTN